jgi:hypothetical protein
MSNVVALTSPERRVSTTISTTPSASGSSIFVAARRRTIIELGLEEFQASVLAADLHYLLEHTQNLSAIVRASEAPFTMESRERLVAFVSSLQTVLR